VTDPLPIILLAPSFLLLDSLSSWSPAFPSLVLYQLTWGLVAEHTSKLRPLTQGCPPLTFLSSTNSFSAAVRLLISSSYLWEDQDSWACTSH
jgi:hypothetical protein